MNESNLTLELVGCLGSADGVSPPLCNTGGKVAPDYVSVSFDGANLSQVSESEQLRDVSLALRSALLLPVELVQEGKGLLGFDNSASIILRADFEDVVLGRVAWGGDSQRGKWFVQISGLGCEQVSDWRPFVAWCEGFGASLRRCDLKVDDLDGRYGVVDALQAYMVGGFNSAQGRSPSSQRVGDWDVPGSPRGRTLYIGRRANGKMLRVYEKGKQMGDPCSPHVRWEVEWRAKDRVLPFDMLLNCEKYFAGAYPMLGELARVAAEKIRTIRAATRVRADALVQCAKVMFGKLVDVLLQHFEGDYAEVVELIRRPGVPRRLKGVRVAGMVEHLGYKESVAVARGVCKNPMIRFASSSLGDGMTLAY